MQQTRRGRGFMTEDPRIKASNESFAPTRDHRAQKLFKFYESRTREEHKLPRSQSLIIFHENPFPDEYFYCDILCSRDRLQVSHLLKIE